MKVLLFVLFGLTLMLGRSVADNLAPAPSAEQVKELEHEWADIQKSGPPSSRALLSFIMESAALDYHPERTSRALDFLEQMQDKDPASSSYGNFRWYWNQPKPVDLNAVEFIMQRGLVLWNLYRNRLSAEDKNRLQRIILLAAHGVASHHVEITYTNIFLMKSWNCIGIGEAFQQPALADEGYRMFAEWIRLASRNGVQEYLSPTYYGTDLDSLSLIRQFAARPETQAAADAVMRFYWVQCRANWFAPDERLGGPHSRDYDYLTGHGYLDFYTSYWGWISDSSDYSTRGLNSKARPDGYQPTALNKVFDMTLWKPNDVSAYVAADQIPRFVETRFGGAPDQIATQYVGPSLSIGVAGRSVGAEDKIFTIQFDGGPSMVMGNLFVDGRGDPYGQNKVADKNGHKKAHHLVPLVASVQAGPNVLLLTSFGGGKTKSRDAEPSLLATHLDLPAEISLWQEEKETVVAPGQSTPLNPALPVYVRYGKTAVGFKFLQATNDQGKSISPVFYRDGGKFHACRISWAQAGTAPTGEAHLLLLATAQEKIDNDDLFVQFRKKFAAIPVSFHLKDQKISARAELADRPALTLDADLITGATSRGTSPPSGVLLINGNDVGTPILNEALKDLPAPLNDASPK